MSLALELGVTGIGSLCYYPRPRGWRVQYFVCLCVCYHKIAVKFKLSQILNKLQLTNLVILDKQWFSTTPFTLHIYPRIS